MRLPCKCKRLKGAYIPAVDCTYGANVMMAETLNIRYPVWYGTRYHAIKFGTKCEMSKPTEEGMKIIANPNTKVTLIVDHHLMPHKIYYYGDQIFEGSSKPAFATDPNVPDVAGYEVMRPIPRRGSKALPFMTRQSLMAYLQQAFANQND